MKDLCSETNINNIAVLDENRKNNLQNKLNAKKEDNSKKDSEQKNSMNLTYTVKQLAKQIGTNVEMYDSSCFSEVLKPGISGTRTEDSNRQYLL